MDRLTYFDCGKWRLKIGDMEYSGEIADKLAHYEDLADQGRLVELPCDIGSIVYEIYQFCGDGAWEYEEHYLKLEDLPNIGKTVFLTREEAEAEAKLAEMKGE